MRCCTEFPSLSLPYLDELWFPCLAGSSYANLSIFLVSGFSIFFPLSLPAGPELLGVSYSAAQERGLLHSLLRVAYGYAPSSLLFVGWGNQPLKRHRYTCTCLCALRSAYFVQHSRSLQLLHVDITSKVSLRASFPLSAARVHQSAPHTLIS